MSLRGSVPTPTPEAVGRVIRNSGINTVNTTKTNGLGAFRRHGLTNNNLFFSVDTGRNLRLPHFAAKYDKN